MQLTSKAEKHWKAFTELTTTKALVVAALPKLKIPGGKMKKTVVILVRICIR